MIYRHSCLWRSKGLPGQGTAWAIKANPKDAIAVMALYETCRRTQTLHSVISAKNELGRKAVLNPLVAVGFARVTCDLETTPGKEWIVHAPTPRRETAGSTDEGDK